MSVNDLFSSKIKELRVEMNMTQKEFSEHIGISQQVLSGYERSITTPSLEILRAIAEKCNVSIDWLVGLSNKKNNIDEIVTYADAIRLIKKLCDSDFFFGNWNISCNISETKDLNYASIYSSNYKIIELFNDWVHMKELFDKGTITEHLYDLWLEDKLKEYEVAINPDKYESTLDIPGE